MPRKCVVIGLPTFGINSFYWTISYGGLQGPMNAITPRIIKWGLEIGIARNSIVADTLSQYPDASHIFFWDDDVVAHPCCLLQLLKSGKPITAGVYYLKNPVSQALIFDRPGCGTIPYVPGSGLKKVYGAAGGLTLIETQVFRDMQERLDLGTDARGNPQWFRTLGDEPGDPVVNEDSYFYTKANEAGIEVWVDMSPYAFGWHLDIKEQIGYPAEQWREFMSKGTATWELSDLQAKELIGDREPANVV